MKVWSALFGTFVGLAMWATTALALTPVMIPDSGGFSQMTLTTSWQKVQDTGVDTIVLGSTFGIPHDADGYVVSNGGWQPATNGSVTATVTCRYYNQVNDALVPNLLGGNGQWSMTVPANASFTIPIPPVWIEKGCTVNASCVTPLADGDKLEIEMDCFATPSSGYGELQAESRKSPMPTSHASFSRTSVVLIP